SRVQSARLVRASQPLQGALTQLGKLDLLPAVALAAEMVNRHVRGDPRQPMLEGSAAIELAQSPPGLDEGFLREVFHLVGIALVTMKDCEDAPLVAADEFAKLVRGAGANASHQFRILAHLWLIICH